MCLRCKSKMIYMFFFPDQLCPLLELSVFGLLPLLWPEVVRFSSLWFVALAIEEDLANLYGFKWKKSEKSRAVRATLTILLFFNNECIIFTNRMCRPHMTSSPHGIVLSEAKYIRRDGVISSSAAYNFSIVFFLPFFCIPWILYWRFTCFLLRLVRILTPTL